MTAGPTDERDRAVTIGEAAHIYGALPGAARFRPEMTDGARAEITNGIWLCRNCHALIDKDRNRYPAELLFLWRREHEEHILERLGSKAEGARRSIIEKRLHGAFDDDLLARQIVLEQLPGWKFRLVAELLRYELGESERRWNDLRRNLVVRKLHILDDDHVMPWFQARMREAEAFIDPLTKLYTEEIIGACGEPGEPGDPIEIARTCGLAGRVAEELVRWEDEVRFVWVSSDYEALIELLPGIMGRQLERLLAIPNVLDAGVDEAEANPDRQTVVEHTILFDLPPGWAEAVTKAIRAIN